MKKLSFLTVGLWFIWNIPLQAQSPLPEKKVSISCQQLSLAAVCEQLQQEYHISFAYFNHPAALQKPISMEVKAQPLKIVLDQLLSGTNMQYQVMDNQIALKEYRQTVFFGFTGKVIDKLTQAPLQAASVSVVGTPLNTVTNAEGRFSLSLPEYYREVPMAISYVGYQTYVVPKTQLLPGEVLVELKPQSQVLEEVLVEEKGGFSLLPKTITDILEKYKADTLRMIEDLPTPANGLVIQGNVLDKDTRKPVHFCKIGLPDHQTQVASDFNGSFRLTLPATYRQDTLLFSSLIYQEQKVPIAALRGEGSTVMLEKRSSHDETVIAQLRDSRVLMDKGIARISGNYAATPTLLKEKYRETMKIAGSDAYLINLEATLETYKPPYRERDLRREQVSLLSGKQQKPIEQIGYDGRAYELPNWLLNSLYTINGMDIVQGFNESFDPRAFARMYDFSSTRGIQYDFNPDSFLSIKKAKAYHVQLLDLITLNGEQVFVLAFEPSSIWKASSYFQGRLFVEVKTLAFIRAEYQLNPGGVTAYNFLEDTPIRMSRRNYVVNYTKDQGRWNFDRASMETEYCLGYQPVKVSVPILSRVDLITTQRESVQILPQRRPETIKDSYKTFVVQMEEMSRRR